MSNRPQLLLEHCNLAGNRYEVPVTGLRLGRSSSNNVCVLDEELSRNHCLFEAVGEDRIRVTDLASANGTFLNGQRLGACPTELRAGDVLTLGNSVIKIVSNGQNTDGPTVFRPVEEPASSAYTGKRLGNSRRILAIVLWFAALAAFSAIGYMALVYAVRH